MSVECQVNVKSQSELDIGGRETCFPLSYLSLQSPHKRLHLQEERPGGYGRPRLLQREQVLPGNCGLPDGPVGQVQQRVALVVNLKISLYSAASITPFTEPSDRVSQLLRVSNRPVQGLEGCTLEHQIWRMVLVYVQFGWVSRVILGHSPVNVRHHDLGGAVEEEDAGPAGDHGPGAGLHPVLETVHSRPEAELVKLRMRGGAGPQLGLWVPHSQQR